MTRLRKLNAKGFYCAIDQDRIKNLNLIELNISDNKK